MSSEKNLLNDVGILFLIILIGVAIFETNSHAATPFEQVEEAVGGGAIYMNVDGIETTYESIKAFSGKKLMTPSLQTRKMR